MEKTVRELRNEKGLSSKYVAEKLNLKKSAYLRRERNEVEFSAKEIIDFAKLLGVPAEEIKV